MVKFVHQHANKLAICFLTFSITVAAVSLALMLPDLVCVRLDEFVNEQWPHG